MKPLQLTSYPSHSASINVLTYSDDGKLIASSDVSGKSVLVWGGQRSITCNASPEPTHAIISVTFLEIPNTRYIAAGRSSGMILVWNASSGALLWVLTFPGGMNMTIHSDIRGFILSLHGQELTVFTMWNNGVFKWRVVLPETESEVAPIVLLPVTPGSFLGHKVDTVS